MASHAAIRVDNDLPAGQAGIRHRAADHEPAARVDDEPGLLVQQLRRHHRADHELLDILLDLLVRHAVEVLRGNQDGVDPNRLALRVLDRYLALAVRQQVRQIAVLANLGQLAGHLVRQRDRQRHQLRRLVGREADHHALVTRTDLIVLVARRRGAALQRVVNAAGDVRALLLDRHDDAALARIEPVVRVRVTNLRDDIANQLLDIDVGTGRDFAEDQHESGRYRGFACHAGIRILREHGVKHRVGDLVTDLVGMPFRHRLRREKQLPV